MMDRIRLGRRVIEKDDEGDRPRKLVLPKEPLVDDHKQFIPKERRTTKALENFEYFQDRFNEAVALAEQAAQGCTQSYTEFTQALQSEHESVQTRLEQLKKLREGLPKFDGGKDEKAPGDSAPSADDNTGAGENPVSTESKPVDRRS